MNFIQRLIRLPFVSKPQVYISVIRTVSSVAGTIFGFVSGVRTLRSDVPLLPSLQQSPQEFTLYGLRSFFVDAIRDGANHSAGELTQFLLRSSFNLGRNVLQSIFRNPFNPVGTTGRPNIIGGLFRTSNLANGMSGQTFMLAFSDIARELIGFGFVVGESLLQAYIVYNILYYFFRILRWLVNKSSNQPIDVEARSVPSSIAASTSKNLLKRYINNIS